MRRLLILALLLLPGPALAHPHVLVDVHALAEFKDGKIVSLFMGWRFDAVFSASLLKDFDKNGDNRLDAGEMKDLEREAFRDTKPQSHFTYARIGTEPVVWPDATDFKVIAVKDSLMYAFRLPLPRPVDPRRESFSFTTFEETFYIDMDFPTDNAVTLNGDGAAGCKAVIAPDHGNTIFGGAVTPKRATVTCG